LRWERWRGQARSADSDFAGRLYSLVSRIPSGLAKTQFVKSDRLLDPVGLSDQVRRRLAGLGEKYLKTLKDASYEMRKSGLMLQTFEYASTKSVIDEIDTVLAGHYGFTAEELDFILNYDIKYRLGRDAEGEEE